MLKLKKKYRFINDIEKAREIFGEFITVKGERITTVDIEDDNYSAVIDWYEFDKPDPDRREDNVWIGRSKLIITNDFEVVADSEFYNNETATESLRTYQTKTIGEEYVNALEKYLRKNTNKEIKKYKKLLETEAE